MTQLTEPVEAYQLDPNGKGISPDLKRWFLANPQSWQNSFPDGRLQVKVRGKWVDFSHSDWICFDSNGLRYILSNAEFRTRFSFVEKRDLAKAKKLLAAVEPDGCNDVDGENWYDARDAFLEE